MSSAPHTSVREPCPQCTTPTRCGAVVLKTKGPNCAGRSNGPDDCDCLNTCGDDPWLKDGRSKPCKDHQSQRETPSASIPGQTITVSAQALRTVLIALNGPAHHIRELQHTRSLRALGHDSAIDTLLDEFNAQANQVQQGAPASTTATYSLDTDPQGIRALAADAITGALAFGAQGSNPPPAGHWLEPFWRAARAEVAPHRLPLTRADADLLDQAIYDLALNGETDVPASDLHRFAAMELLECVQWRPLRSAQVAIDAAREEGGAA